MTEPNHDSELESAKMLHRAAEDLTFERVLHDRQHLFTRDHHLRTNVNQISIKKPPIWLSTHCCGLEVHGIVCGTSLKEKVKFEVSAVIMKLSKARVCVTSTKKISTLCADLYVCLFFIAHTATN